MWDLREVCTLKNFYHKVGHGIISLWRVSFPVSLGLYVSIVIDQNDRLSAIIHLNIAVIL